MTTKPLQNFTHWRAGAEADDEPVEVSQAEAEETWAAAVHPVLAEVASSYQGLILTNDLAARLQADTGIKTRSNASGWLDRVLTTAAAADVEQGRPPLTALVVHKAHGTVGPVYSEVLRLTGEQPIEDERERERHAAEARMECYRWAGAKMPSDGGHAALSPRYDLVLTRDRKKARDEAVANVCPSCFMAIPPTGRCDNCG